MNSALKKSILFAKIITSDLKNIPKVAVPKYIMDERLTMYFRERTYYYVQDPLKCKEGDYVIIRELAESDDKRVTHKVEQLVYERGNFVDPITGKRCAGTEFIDDIKRTCDLFGFERPYFKK
ncbi:hypothetical protein JTE90_015137 [Oedothorax gibbosus]|uniref:Mitochondrial ribosomal protein S17 n=1 Tax=Oedothorax gibbosus TaxID=931172 RepID=A0AAV6VQJ7_9ARAC|nr:hypothetical protein JTE90_015137 [Oedothorax gibbosus]